MYKSNIRNHAGTYEMLIRSQIYLQSKYNRERRNEVVKSSEMYIHTDTYIILDTPLVKNYHMH